MLRFVALTLLIAGCAGSALPLDQQQPAPIVQSPQCVWHFTAPDDTSDSDERPGVATCNAGKFDLHDSALDIYSDRDSATVGGCIAVAASVSHGADYWFVDVSGCGVAGMIGVNLR
jgi:hypothetical protein